MALENPSANEFLIDIWVIFPKTPKKEFTIPSSSQNMKISKNIFIYKFLLCFRYSKMLIKDILSLVPIFNLCIGKINENGTEFRQGEIAMIKKRYNLTAEQVTAIFFAD